MVVHVVDEGLLAVDEGLRALCSQQLENIHCVSITCGIPNLPSRQSFLIFCRRKRNVDTEDLVLRTFQTSAQQQPTGDALQRLWLKSSVARLQ